MKIRSLLINVFAVVIMSGVVAFAVSEFVKSRQQMTMSGQQRVQFNLQSEQIKRQKIDNSMLQIRNRALFNDKKSIDKVVRDHMGLMQRYEIHIPLSEL